MGKRAVAMAANISRFDFAVPQRAGNLVYESVLTRSRKEFFTVEKKVAL
jgi:hypothetical protein